MLFDQRCPCAAFVLTCLVTGPSHERAEPRPAAPPTWGPWSELLPLDQSESQGGLAQRHAPEIEIANVMLDGPGPNRERGVPAKGGGEAHWRPLERAPADAKHPDQALFDFTQGLASDEIRHAVAYLHRTITSDAARGVSTLVGSDDGLQMWLNGETILDQDVLRGFRRGQHEVQLALDPGVNHLLVKVANAGGAWKFQMIHDPALVHEVERETEQEINTAIDRGVDYLLRTQEIDGSWRHSAQEYRNGQAALSLYTLIKSGVSARHHALRRALAYLRSHGPRKTYSAACQLMAYDALGDESLVPEMEEIAKLLLDWQRKGWAYPGGTLDLSNTQYAALGLRAAAKSGVRIPEKAWTSMAIHALDYFTNDGGFSYRRSGPATSSMTAGGLTVLAICREQLGPSSTLTPRHEREFRLAQEEGLEWLVRHYSVDHNRIPTNGTNSDRWHYYYLYGLERVGAFTGLERFGPYRWYWDGSQALLSKQSKDKGSWGDNETQPNTCFALLFLRRATAVVSGQAARTRLKTYGRDDKEKDVSLRGSGDSPLTLWISTFGDEAREKHAWPESEGGGLRVSYVDYVSGGEVLARVDGDPRSPPGPDQRYAARVSFPSLGEYLVQARVKLVRPGGEITTLQSGVIKVRIEERIEDWMLEYASDSARNLLADVKREVDASSQLGNGMRAAYAADNVLATCWLSADSDEEHTLRINLRKPVRADTIVLTPAIPAPLEPNGSARVRRVALYVNKRKKPIEVELDPDGPGKTAVTLKRAETVRMLELRILETVPGKKRKFAAGFAEVELQLRK